MKIYKISKEAKIKKYKKHKKPESHVGKMEGAYNPPNWSGKLDTRLTPVHRYTLEETDLDFSIILKGTKYENKIK